MNNLDRKEIAGQMECGMINKNPETDFGIQSEDQKNKAVGH